MRFFRQAVATVVGLLLIPGCASNSTKTLLSGSVQPVLPEVAQSGDGSSWAYVSTPNLAQLENVTGPDGRIWFIGGPEGNPASNIYAVTQAGQVTEMTNFVDVLIQALTVGPDKNIWFTTYGSNGLGVVKITPTGAVTAYPVANFPTVICSGPDGDLWFADESSIDRMTTSGVVTNIPTGLTDVTSITPGEDGGIWFTVRGVGRDTIGRIDVKTLALKTIDATQYGPLLGNIVAGGDGNLWTSRQTDGALVRITSSWSISAYKHGFQKRMEFNPWLTSYGTVLYAAYGYSKYLIRFGERSTKPIDITRLPNPNSSEPVFSTIGPDLNLWTTSDTNMEFAVYLIHALKVSPTSISVTIGGNQTLTASEHDVKPSRLRATSSDPTVASVANGPAAGTFVVTGIASGHCVVTVFDHVGNSVDIPVTVD